MPSTPDSLKSRRCVLLRHTLPDGSSHFDWMLEVAPNAPLRTFRLDQPPEAPAAFFARSMPDHRHAYLSYEGPVSGGRGSVVRVRTGEVLDYAELARTIDLAFRWGGDATPTRLRARLVEGDRWEFRPPVTDL